MSLLTNLKNTFEPMRPVVVVAALLAVAAAQMPSSGNETETPMNMCDMQFSSLQMCLMVREPCVPIADDRPPGVRSPTRRRAVFSIFDLC